MISLTITKTGRIELDRPVKATCISLNAITLYLNVYNIPTESTYVKDGKTTTIAPGYYTYEQLQRRIPFKFDDNTLKVTVDGTVTGSLKQLIDNDFPHFSPLCFYLYIDGIDTSTNYDDGKRSSLLSIIPIGKTEISEIFKYQPYKNLKKMCNNEINHLTIKILDEYGKEYRGRFVAELTIT